MLSAIIESMKSLRGRADALSGVMMEASGLGADSAMWREVGQQLARVSLGLRNWEKRLTGECADVKPGTVPSDTIPAVIELCGDMREMMIAAGATAEQHTGVTAENLHRLSTGFPGYLDRIDRILGVVRPARSGDDPLNAVAEKLEGVKARLDAVKSPAGFSFKSDFLAKEGRVSESPVETDRRLLAEFERLETARPLSGASEARRVELFSNFYSYKG